MEHKAFDGPMTLKDEASGEVEAIVANIGTPDKDGDVLLAGALRQGKTLISLYGHDVVLRSEPPVGVGAVVEEGAHAVFRGKFFIKTTRGKEGFELIRGLGDAAGWSYGFPESSAATRPASEEWRRKGARRLLAGIEVLEVSPVFRPAGFSTRTVSTKQEADEVAAEVKRFEAAVERAGTPPDVPLPARFNAFADWVADRFALTSSQRPVIKMVLPSRLPDGATGMYDRKSRTVMIRAGMNDETTRAVICHEFAHCYEDTKNWSEHSEGFAMASERQLLRRWHDETRRVRR